jgi:hypothetical protein
MAFYNTKDVRPVVIEIPPAGDDGSTNPTCPAADMVATGMLEEIAQAPFDS